ncbi:helix-turn-helix domain-containing protein [Enterococcus casseliflavus]|uniref:helix-turn-helix domain-containing protein n=2 Tax=Enterococcus casseliflavus TaxID=37734 RepID=UPI0033987202
MNEEKKNQPQTLKGEQSFKMTKLKGSPTVIQRKYYEEAIFIYVRSGQGSLFIENTCIKINRYDFVMISPSVPIHIDQSDNDVIMIIQAPPKFIKKDLFPALKNNEQVSPFFFPFVYETPMKTPYIYFKSRDTSPLNSFNNFYYEWQKKDKNPRIITLFLAIMIEDISQSYEMITSCNLFKKESVDIQGIIDYIELHLNSITLKKLARHFHYNPTYLSTFFKKNTSMKFSDYVKMQKMEKAKEYLLHTDHSIDQIAILLGYSDRSQFFQVFKAYYGISPSDFKKSRRSHTFCDK